MANKNNIIKGKYTKSNDYKMYYASGVNFTISNNKALMTFFNEVPAQFEGFEIKVDNNGNYVSAKDIVSNDASLERVQQCTIEMDLTVAKELFDFLAKNVNTEEENG